MPAILLRAFTLLLPLLVIGGASRAHAQAIPVARADVNGDCVVNRTDAELVRASFGRRCGQPGFNPKADINQDCIVNNFDLTFVSRNVGAQVCEEPPPPPPPPPAPKIDAAITPSANTFGWHNTDVLVTFTCTDATSCPSPVTVSTEGEGQVVSRTVSNTAGATAMASVTLNIDKTPPTLSAVSPALAVPGQMLSVEGTASSASGIASISLRVRATLADTTNAAPFTLTHALAQDAVVGTAEPLDVVAEDRAGNRASLRRLVTIDLPDEVPPVVALTAPVTAPPGATIPLLVQASDDGQLERVVLTRTGDDGGETIDDRTAGPFVFQSLVQIPDEAIDGDLITFAVMATDAAGNNGTSTAAVTVVTSAETQALQLNVTPPLSPTFQNRAVVTGTIGNATIAAPSAAPPIIAGVSPQSGRQGQTLTVQITGINTTFSELSQATFGPGLTVLSINPTDASTLSVQVAIDPQAGVGPRLVAVQTGQQESLLASAFSVRPGFGTVTGRLLDGAGNAIANAQLCLPNSTTCTTTDAEGRYSFGDVTSDVRRVVVTADGFEGVSLDVKLGTGDSASLGDVTLVPALFPPPPPMPNAPPVGPRLATVFGRGATALGVGGDPAQYVRIIQDAIVAVGGSEIGVLDAFGNQLNPHITGAGVASFTHFGVEETARDMVAGDSLSLAELFKVLAGSLVFPDGVPYPSLLQLIDAFQELADQAWANPTRTEAPLLMLLFNQGRVVSPAAPRISFDTQFNPLQQQLLATSFLAFVHQVFPPPPPLDGRLDEVIPGVPRRGIRSTIGALARLLRPEPVGNPYGAVSASASLPAGWSAPTRTWGAPGLRTGMARGAAALQTVAPPLIPGPGPPGSLMWEAAYEKILPDGGWTVAKNSGKLCDEFLVYVAGKTAEAVDGRSPAGFELIKDPNAKILPGVGCKDAVSLAQMIFSGRKEANTFAAGQFEKFLLSEKVTRANAARVRQTMQSGTIQQGWTEAKAAIAKDRTKLEQQKKLVGFARSFATGYLTKVQGAAIDGIFALEVHLLLQSVRPRPPLVADVTQLIDPETGQPGRVVKIRFSRSTNDNGTTADIRWEYELFRQQRGNIDLVASRPFLLNDAAEFYDEVPDEGMYGYLVRGVRRVGDPYTPAKTAPSVTSRVLSFLGGFVSTSVSIAGKQVVGLGIVQTVGDPLAKIYQGINVQASDFSDPEFLYVTTRPPTPRPPASMAVDRVFRRTYLSVPSLGTIARITEGVATPFAQAGFAQPNQVGLAVDSRGDVYTTNSASEMRFGGRVFSFSPFSGARALAGTVNYYSFLLQYAHPVAVVNMTAGPSAEGEAIYFADAFNQRITRMRLPWTFTWDPSRNVSQPVATSPQFGFGPGTYMAVRGDSTLAVTQFSRVFRVTPFGAVFDFVSPGNSPFAQLTGAAFDRAQNLYLADSSTGTITMVPPSQVGDGSRFGQLSAIARKKHTVARGLRRPTDIQLAPTRDGLVFFDAERAYVYVPFGMTGQLTDASGSPIAGADVYVPERRRLTVTDSDGIYVLDGLVSAQRSPVVEYVVRYEGRSQSYSTVLDPFSHSIVDTVFAPPPLPPPGPTQPSITEPTPLPPTPRPSGSDTISVAFDLDAPPEPEPPGVKSCPRGVFVAPGLGVAIQETSAVVTGWLTKSATSVRLVANGTATTIPVTGQDFSTSQPLTTGENVMYLALPASSLKSSGCVEPDVPDDELVSISATHTVFHDVRLEEIERYRQRVGYDLAVRVIVRESSKPAAGVSFHVPGTSLYAVTDADGVAQVNLPTKTMSGSIGTTDALAQSFFTRSASLVTLLRSDRRAEAIAALEALMQQAISVSDEQEPVGVHAGDLLAYVLLIEGTARRLLDSLQSEEGIPDEADIDALETVALQVGTVDANGEIVVKSREYPQLRITVKVAS